MQHDLSFERGDVRVRPMRPDEDSVSLFAFIDPDVYRGFTGPMPQGPDDLARGFAARVASPSSLVFTVEKDDQVVGTSTIYDLDAQNLRGAIGHTLYAPSVWGTTVNPYCKLVLMSHLFDTMGYQRCELRCDERNARSAGAIRKLGATLEGRLRNHRAATDGERSDSLVFSVIASEWPGVRAGLEFRLSD